ncbi:metallopeptidase family protein [Demequina sp. NBRC 110056]|uniref:metallopeptidase family protein n=1 Tax=Demequina sp. NBRC 110056 TaxID=1570345 RepID=UPI000A044055|nr:metallopeptidase family protein [Demequina sp. NBRC 110056]
MARRDRHGRGLRAPLLPYDAPGYRTRGEVFDDELRDAAERLESRWGRAWGRIDFAAEDVPPSDPTPWEHGVPLGRVFPAELGQPTRVVVYRRPLELRADPGHVRPILRDVLAEQVGAVLGRAPEDVDPDYGAGE